MFKRIGLSAVLFGCFGAAQAADPMCRYVEFGDTDVIVEMTVKDSTTGMPLAGLTYNGTSPTVTVRAKTDVSASATYVGGATGNLENIGTLYTYAEPASGKAKFKETDLPGKYQMQFRNTGVWNVANASEVTVSVSGTGILTSRCVFPQNLMNAAAVTAAVATALTGHTGGGVAQFNQVNNRTLPATADYLTQTEFNTADGLTNDNIDGVDEAVWDSICEPDGEDGNPMSCKHLFQMIAAALVGCTSLQSSNNAVHTAPDCVTERMRHIVEFTNNTRTSLVELTTSDD